MKYLFMALIRAYQLTVSKMIGPVCRFYPTCSHYGYEAFRLHGTLRGGWLTARRLLRCHPWNPGGVDPVPERRPSRTGRGGSAPAEPRERAGRFRGPGHPPAPAPVPPARVPPAPDQSRQGAAR